MTKCAFTIADDRYYYPVGTHIFVNSFKRFHPDISLIVFRQNTIDKVMVNGINFYNAKPTFAKLLTDKYDMIVNIDADTIILDRLKNIFDNDDWEVGGVWNKNDYEDATFENITPEMYVQAGLVGSTKPEFWDIWEQENKKATDYIRKENDILNLVWYNNDIVNKMNRVIWDKEYGYMGCKSLGREAEFKLVDKQILLRDEPVSAYHWARGGVSKMNWDLLSFPYDVKNYFNYIGSYGQTVTYV